MDRKVDWVEAVSIDYGQRHVKETEHARATCNMFGIKHTTLVLKDLLSGKDVMLTDKSVEVPNTTYDKILGVSPTYVPFRNGTMLSVITAHAQKYVNSEIDKRVADLYTNTAAISEAVAKDRATKEARDLVGIYFGAHAEDAQNWAYPDCTPEFVGAMANAIYVGSYFAIRLHTPFVHSEKWEIVARGEDMGVDWSKTWSCYKGEDVHCGTCPTCQARKESFKRANVVDPTEYAV
jgi:7-cyano-7-deazaguanine synthase